MIIILNITLILSIFLIFVKNTALLRFLSLFGAVVVFLLSGQVLCEYLNMLTDYEGIFFYPSNNDLIFYNLFGLFGIEYKGSLDGISAIFVFLSAILLLVCIICAWNQPNLNYLMSLLFLVTFMTLNVFYVYDLFFFFIFYEAILIPMFFIIGIWGTGDKDRKISAAFRFFLYTLFGSIFFFFCILIIFFQYGTTNLYELILLIDETVIYDSFYVKLFWLFFFFAFAVKVPLVPFHSWLPEAHAEAPTVGSVLLAGILLKMGPYGLIKFSDVLFSYGLYYYRPLLYILCFIGMYYTALTAIRQIDLKKVIAYSSIGHMALVIMGIISNSYEGLLGAILLMVGHGFGSAGLFLIIGYLYDRYKTRSYFYYGGLVQINPILTFIMFIFLLGNVALPGTLNFIAEVLILISVFKLNTYLAVLTVLSSVIVLAYNLYFFHRVFFGTVERKEWSFSSLNVFKKDKDKEYRPDLSLREISSSIILVFPLYFSGLFPSFLIKFLDLSIFNILFLSSI